MDDLKAEMDRVAKAMIPDVRSLAGDRDFLEAWVPEIRENRLREERAAEERREREAYNRDPIAFLAEKIERSESSLSAESKETDLRGYMEQLLELKDKGYGNSAIRLYNACVRMLRELRETRLLLQEKRTETAAELKNKMRETENHQKKCKITHYGQFGRFANDWDVLSDKYNESLGSANPLVKYCRERAAKLRKKEKWGESGMCIHCGGRLSFFVNACNSCGKVNVRYKKRGVV